MSIRIQEKFVDARGLPPLMIFDKQKHIDIQWKDTGALRNILI